MSARVNSLYLHATGRICRICHWSRCQWEVCERGKAFSGCGGSCQVAESFLQFGKGERAIWAQVV